MGSESFNQALLSLDMPSWAYIGNGVQMYADGDMALAGTANYTVGNGATISSNLALRGTTSVCAWQSMFWRTRIRRTAAWCRQSGPCIA